ncbi:putative thiol-specific monooxygenase protein [Phaeoacremonium minimum UCRPA7]|uniref:Putative thiol-specific monooxygenase protein n=1 Tax=Phaeoacremonium minimum (strain UCR-PA7) TaxID=1286976 RepID=R8BQ78_PHAM7|nr:putative thiol-specific monooxygenase protein [Phaeoacremonium minimum UCRPA7]EOO01489.1 putative thiol-specific monooxygenase protein [Phaeoacremonium minimum UCRPA7]
MGSVAPKQFDIKSVAIIGAGPCGLSAAKYLIAEGSFENIVIYEQQPEVGGVWFYSKKPSQTLHVPQVSPLCPPDPPISSKDGANPIFPSPMYDLLHTNIPHDLMRFGDLEFPQNSLIFPPREEVQEYLVKYSQDIRQFIKFSTEVKHVELRQESGKDVWDVTAESTVTRDAEIRTFDAVVVASGHYATTFIPNVKNIKAFHEAYPGVITHSKLYRSPEDFTGKKVLIVGNSASGLDIATQISRFSQSPLLLSVHSPTPADNLAHARAEEVPAIEEFLLDERGVKFEGGRVEKDIDAIIYATGYLFAFQFLPNLDPPLVTDGRRVYGLYKHFIHIDHPTIVFPGLPYKVVPFPFSEGQAAVFAKVWSNSLALPTAEAMKKWEEEEAERKQPAFHVFPKGGDSEYLKEMHAWAMQATTKGKEPPVWNDYQIWQREIYFEAKLKFEMDGRRAKSLEELGFRFEPPEVIHNPKEIL